MRYDAEWQRHRAGSGVHAFVCTAKKPLSFNLFGENYALSRLAVLMWWWRCRSAEGETNGGTINRLLLLPVSVDARYLFVSDHLQIPWSFGGGAGWSAICICLSFVPAILLPTGQKRKTILYFLNGFCVDWGGAVLSRVSARGKTCGRKEGGVVAKEHTRALPREPSLRPLLSLERTATARVQHGAESTTTPLSPPQKQIK